MILQFPHKETTAISLYLRAVEIDDRDPEEGMRLYRRALQLNPSDDKTMSNLGRLYYLRGEHGAAETWWLRALKANPGQTEANHNLGYLRSMQGLHQSAIVFFEAAISTDEGFADAHFNLAESLEKAGRGPEARVHWRRYIQLGGEYREAAMTALGMRVVK
jgi:tetratricopeptide (TPR) repeat protein